MIHPAAFVHPKAELGRDVEVGPGAIIEAGCVIGDGCEIQAHAVITGGTILGPRNRIGFGALIGGEPQDLSFQGGPSRVEIGADNRIREYTTIHRGTAEGSVTRIGDQNFLMGGVHIAHNCAIGNLVVIVNNTLLGGYVRVEDRAFLGGATLVHQHVRIGSLVMTRGGTRISRDVPPYCTAAGIQRVVGLNRLGLRRAGFSAETRRLIQTAYDLLYRNGLNRTQALVQLRSLEPNPEVAAFVEFVEQSKRGVCRHRDGQEDDDE